MNDDTFCKHKKYQHINFGFDDIDGVSAEILNRNFPLNQEGENH